MASLRLWFILFFSYSTALPPRKSCQDHYLNGEFKSGVRPILGENDDVYEIECVAPSESESDQFVGTKIHTALEQWTTVESGKRSTVGFQIADRKTLRKIVRSSERCTQEIFIRWPTLNPMDLRLKENQFIGFTIESILGKQRIFRRNMSFLEAYEEAVILESYTLSENKEAGVLHILGTDADGHPENRTALVRSSPLVCSQKIVEKVECLFELNDKSDWLKISSSKEGKIQFSFRTDKPESPFMRIFLTDSSFINIDLLDGYLLTVDHMVHPAKLLADGNWHTVVLDVSSLSLQIDGSSPIISFAAISEGNPLVELQILLNGQIAGIKTGESEDWLCADSKIVEKKLTEQILRKICPSYEENYCRCLAPRSVLPKDTCKDVDEKTGFQLARKSDQLSFFFINGFSEKSRVNIVFKSDSDSGLVMFGVVNTKLSMTRIQIHFSGEKMYGVQCSRTLSSLNEKCRTCSITKKSKFGKNDWITVSFFHYGDYQFLAVDSDVCRLAPEMTSSAEAHFLDGASLYETDSTVESALFVGGTYYTKTNDLNRKVEDFFRKKFLDHTREKPPSLRGCVGRLVVNGEVKNLQKIMENQVSQISKKNDPEIFSMKLGCQNCRIPLETCNGAKCRSFSPILGSSQICDCSSIFSIQDQSTGRCVVEAPASQVGSLGGYGSVLLTSPQETVLDRVVFTNSGKTVLDKIWMLLRFPEVNEDPERIFTLGMVSVKVGNNGKTVIVQVENFKEKFEIRTNDDRLHLIAIQRNPTMGTTTEALITVQVDNDVRTLELEEIPILGTSSVEVYPVFSERSDSGEYRHPGCLAELSVFFDYKEDSKKPSRDNRASQVDLLEQIVNNMYDFSDPSETSLIQKSPCGIRDPAIWTSNSSDYGTVGLYDPYGEPDAATSVSIVVTVLVCLLILVLLVAYCYCRQKKSTKYRLNTTRYRPTVGKEEKQPLKHGFVDNSGSSTEHSHVDFSENVSPISQKKPNGVPHGTPVAMNPQTKRTTYEARPVHVEELPGSPRRVSRPVTKRVPPSDSSPYLKSSPRILSSPKPVVIAAQRAPIASPHIDDL